MMIITKELQDILNNNYKINPILDNIAEINNDAKVALFLDQIKTILRASNDALESIKHIEEYE